MPFDPTGYQRPEPPALPPRPTMSKRQEAILLWLVGLWLMGLFIAPIGGSSILHVVAYLLR
jgi:hypothetical protein